MEVATWVDGNRMGTRGRGEREDEVRWRVGRTPSMQNLFSLLPLEMSFYSFFKEHVFI